MNDLSKKIFELASEDQEFCESFNKAADLDAAAALLKAQGIEASAEELEAALKHEEADELSDDELEAVAGGRACGCCLGGAGASGGKDDTCGCVIAGVGMSREEDSRYSVARCVCPVGGGGSSYN